MPLFIHTCFLLIVYVLMFILPCKVYILCWIKSECLPACLPVCLIQISQKKIFSICVQTLILVPIIKIYDNRLYLRKRQSFWRHVAYFWKKWRHWFLNSICFMHMSKKMRLVKIPMSEFAAQQTVVKFGVECGKAFPDSLNKLIWI